MPSGKRCRLRPRPRQVRQHGRTGGDVVAQQVALGDGRMFAIGRDQDLVQVGDAHLVAGHGPMALPLHLVQCFQLGAAGRSQIHFRRRPRVIQRSRLRRGLGRGGRRWGPGRRALAGPAVGRWRLLHDPRGWNRLFPHHGGRIAVQLDPLERRLAQQAVARPVGELGADHDPRLDPARLRQPWLLVPAARPAGGSAPWRPAAPCASAH